MIYNSFLDWKVRYKIIDNLKFFAEKHASYLISSKHFQKYIDSQMKLIQDSNSKIAIQSLQTFQKILGNISVFFLYRPEQLRKLTWCVAQYFPNWDPQMEAFANKQKIYWINC